MSELKAWREANNNMSQTELARRVGTTQPHLSAIENGEGGVSLELSIRVFNETGVCVGKLKNATHKQARALAGLSNAGASQ